MLMTRTGVIRNHTLFGQDIAAISKRTTALVDNTHGFGWSDGGCLMFARALQRWSGGILGVMALQAYAAGIPVFDHAICVMDRFPGYRICLDAEGLSTEEELVRRWKAFHGRTHAGLVPLPALSEMIEDPKIIGALSEEIESQLGPFDATIVFSGALERMGFEQEEETMDSPTMRFL